MSEFLDLTGAAGDGVTDDTQAVADWIGQINGAQPPVALLPPGQFYCSAPLPAITADAVTILGAGWAQQASTCGSSIFSGTAVQCSINSVSTNPDHITVVTWFQEGNQLHLTVTGPQTTTSGEDLERVLLAALALNYGDPTETQAQAIELQLTYATMACSHRGSLMRICDNCVF